jgi:hypothetical protein
MADRREWKIVGALLLLTAVLALLFSPSGARSGFDPRPSSYRATPNGVLGLYLLLEELEIPVGRRTSPLVGADTLPGSLALLAPTERLSPAEVDALLYWLDQGGRLLYAASWGDTLLSQLGLVLDPSFADSVVDAEGAAVAAAVPGAPFTDQVGSVYGFQLAFADSSPAFGEDATAPLLRFPDGAIGAVLLRFGEGQVLAWSDPAPLANHSVRSGGGALLAARAAREFAAIGGRIHFDEYHHGFAGGGSPASALVSFFGGTRAGRMALQLTLIGSGLLFLLGSRFGAPHPAPPPRRRSPLEHLHALAGAYRAGNARNRARHLLLVGLARRVGLRPPASGEELDFLRRLAMARADPPAAAEALLAEWERGDAADLVALAKRADQLVMETKAT